jgi:hypothetical protein
MFSLLQESTAQQQHSKRSIVSIKQWHRGLVRSTLWKDVMLIKPQAAKLPAAMEICDADWALGLRATE